MKYTKCPHCGSGQGFFMADVLVRADIMWHFNSTQIDYTDFMDFEDVHDDDGNYIPNLPVYCRSCANLICDYNEMMED